MLSLTVYRATYMLQFKPDHPQLAKAMAYFESHLAKKDFIIVQDDRYKHVLIVSTTEQELVEEAEYQQLLKRRKETGNMEPIIAAEKDKYDSPTVGPLLSLCENVFLLRELLERVEVEDDFRLVSLVLHFGLNCVYYSRFNIVVILLIVGNCFPRRRVTACCIFITTRRSTRHWCRLPSVWAYWSMWDLFTKLSGARACGGQWHGPSSSHQPWASASTTVKVWQCTLRGWHST